MKQVLSTGCPKKIATFLETLYLHCALVSTVPGSGTFLQACEVSRVVATPHQLSVATPGDHLLHLVRTGTTVFVAEQSTLVITRT